MLIILPRSAGFMTRAACFMPKNTPLISTASERFHSSAGVVSIGPTAPTMPALLNIISSLPNRLTARSTSAATWSSCVTSQTAKAAWSPNCAAKASPGPRCISPMTTLQPSAINRLAVAAPMPIAPPVITATLFSSRIYQYPCCHLRPL